jgi:hypothetical protein
VKSSTTAAPGSNPSKVSGATARAGSRCSPQEVGEYLAGGPRRREASAVSARFELRVATATPGALLDFGPAPIAELLGRYAALCPECIGGQTCDNRG